MTFKPIDLQTSLPRTAEMSPLAQQQTYRQTADQAHLAMQTFKTAEQQANRPTKAESAQEGKVSDREKQDDGRQPPQKRKPRHGKAGPESEKQAAHPYKGKHIDFTG